MVYFLKFLCFFYNNLSLIKFSSRKNLLIYTLTVITILAACGNPTQTNSTQASSTQTNSTQASSTQTSSTQEADSSGIRPIIYTSFHAMYDFTKTIAGDTAEIALLLPQGASAHHWEPSAQDMLQLSQASAFIYHGAGMEHFVHTLKSSLDGQLVFVEASRYVEPALQAADPHLWLNPMYAMQMKETIKHALTNIDPDNAHVFNENFQNASERLLELYDAFHTATSNFIRRDIVVSHGAFGHLSHAFGLNQIPIDGLHHTDPSPARLADIINFIQENGVTTVFYDKSPILAHTIAEETGVNVVMLDTFEGITNDDYFTTMWRNLDVLAEALR